MSYETPLSLLSVKMAPLSYILIYYMYVILRFFEHPYAVEWSEAELVAEHDSAMMKIDFDNKGISSKCDAFLVSMFALKPKSSNISFASYNFYMQAKMERCNDQ